MYRFASHMRLALMYAYCASDARWMGCSDVQPACPVSNRQALGRATSRGVADCTDLGQSYDRLRLLREALVVSRLGHIPLKRPYRHSASAWVGGRACEGTCSSLCGYIWLQSPRATCKQFRGLCMS